MCILENLKGTEEAEILLQMLESYKKIDEEQKVLYETTKFFCPDGCGSCCHNFEPDLLENEALFMAAWIIENSYENALKIAEGVFPFDSDENRKDDKTCPFHDYEKAYHCTIYGGRPSICRLFGASCSKSKNGEKVWKPCKFYPVEELQKYSPLLSHRQFSQSETESILGKMPPLMSDLMEQIENSSISKETKLIREILPKTIQKLLWIMNLTKQNCPL